MTLLHRLASIVRWIVHRNRAEARPGRRAEDVRRHGGRRRHARRRDAGRGPPPGRAASWRRGTGEGTRANRLVTAPGSTMLARDVRYGLRQVRRNPAFSAIAIATLALGIGVNTAMFSAVDAVLIRPLPYADADRLVMVWDDDTRRSGESKFFSTPPEWHEWRRHNTVFTDIAASQPGRRGRSPATASPKSCRPARSPRNFWSVLGARPLLGRVFTEDEDSRGARVVVISHGLWQRRFGASPDVVGRTITLNDSAYEVIGVMPREFYFMPARDIDVWMPTSFYAGDAATLGLARRALRRPAQARRHARAGQRGDGGIEPARLGAARADRAFGGGHAIAGGTGGQDVHVAHRAAGRRRRRSC